MSRLMMLMPAQALALGTISISFADDNNQKGPAGDAKVQPPPLPHKKKKPPNSNLPKGKRNEFG
jgi:hypothetical protein